MFDGSSASLSSKEAGDNKYTFTATAAGGAAPYTYEFKLGGEVVQAASAKNTYTLTATAEGSYTVEVTVKDSAGAVVTKTASVQVGGADDPNTKPTDPITPTPSEVKANLAVEDLGEGIYKFTANAQGGEAPYEYEFSANGTVVKAYSSSNTVTLDMSADGAYTIKVTVKDAKGATAEASKSLTVSGGKVEMPLEAFIDISESGEYLLAKATATGGKGDYQYEFLIDGTVYQPYSNSDNFTFGFDKSITAEYDVSVNVKDSAGAVVKDSIVVRVRNGEYSWGPIADEPVNPTTKPSEPVGEYLKGDADLSGKVNVKDATLIQKYVAKMTDMTEQGKTNGEVDGNGKLNVKDATMIQKFIANMIEW